MDGLILLVILVPLLILILLISIASKGGEHRRLLESLYEKVNELKTEVSGLSKELKKQKEDIPVKTVFKEKPAVVIIPDKPIIQERPVVETEPITIPEPVAEKKIIPEPEKLKEAIKEEPEDLVAAIENHPLLKRDKNIDMERYIGENLANKIGITVLVLGIAFFVKYAIDKNWINEAGRVIIGLISGGILIGLAHFYRNSYRSFSSVLVGGGLTVLYFSIAFAFHQYQLIGQTMAFVYMLIISGFAVVLSLFYNRQELAILATIGGFITPFLVDTGNENYIALFTYLCILNTGLFALSWFKRWPAINSIALFFTTIIFSSWLVKRLYWGETATFPYKDALLFATIFYLLFTAMSIINSVRLRKKFSSFDFLLLLGINFLYYLAGMTILGYWNEGNMQGLFTASLGIFTLVLTGIFYKQENVDRNFISLLTGLTLTYISLIAPVQFEGNYITLFWAAEAVILLFLYQRSKTVLLKIASLSVLALTAANLIINWVQVYFSSNEVIPVIINKGFITTLAVTIALFIYHRLLQKEQGDTFLSNVRTVALKKILLITTIILLYLAGVLEIYYQFSTRITAVPLQGIYLQLYSFLFVIILLRIFRKDQGFVLMKTLLTALCLGIYLFSVSTNHYVSETLINGAAGKSFFIAHWAGASLLLWLLIDFLRSLFPQNKEAWQAYRSSFSWIAAAGILLLLSIEMHHIMLWTQQVKSEQFWWENLYYKAGLSILWSICSFMMMWLGMKYDFRTLRIISLTLFTITLVKLFVYDIRNIPPGGKIAAFILLGCLLLVVSFMYQRLKKIIIDNSIEKEA